MNYYIVTALFQEAKPIIKHLGLKKDKENPGFAVYTSDRGDIKLVITGTGMIAAAAAMGAILALEAVKGNQEAVTVVNFGSCAGRGRMGEIYVCNKIINRITGHTFYPEIRFRHDFSEACLVTEPLVLEKGLDVAGEAYLQDAILHEAPLHEAPLHDMEAAAIYQAGGRLLGPHQMHFIKVVSDSGEGREVDAKKLEEIMEGAAAPFLHYLSVCMEQDRPQKTVDKVHEEEWENLCEQLHASETMRMAVRQCIRYWMLAGVDYQSVLSQMRECGELPCKDRREGKRRFAELKRRLL